MIRPSPYGQRGATPYHFTAPDQVIWKNLVNLPGVRGQVNSNSLDLWTAWDMAPVVAQFLGQPSPPEPSHSSFEQIWTGMDRFRELGFFDKARGKQLEVMQSLGRFDYQVAHLPKRFGKTFTCLATCVARGAKKIIIFCPGYLKPTWRHEILKWFPGSKIVYLEGRSGARGRIAGTRTKIDNRQELKEILSEADFGICNYDILISQQKRDGAGKAYYMPELLGMGPLLYEIPTDAVLLDEAHEAMGYLPNRASLRPHTRADILAALYRYRSKCKIMYAPTATYTGGGDLSRVWNLFRVLAGGDQNGSIWGNSHWNFAARYEGGRKVANPSKYGSAEIWVKGERTNVAEFRCRKERLVYSRSLKEVGEGMPRIERVVRRVEAGDKKWKVPKNVTKSKGKSIDLQLSAAKYKAVAVIPEIQRSLDSGLKVLVLVAHHEPHELLVRGIQGTGHKYLAITGDYPSVEIREAQCRAVKDVEGPMAVIGTHGALRGGLSLGGIDEIHIVEMHYRLDYGDQAEGRPLEYGFGTIRDDGELWLTSYYWVVEGTYDDVVIERMLPKLALIADIEGSEEAETLRRQFIDEQNDDLASALAELAGTVSEEATEAL